MHSCRNPKIDWYSVMDITLTDTLMYMWEGCAFELQAGKLLSVESLVDASEEALKLKM